MSLNTEIDALIGLADQLQNPAFKEDLVHLKSDLMSLRDLVIASKPARENHVALFSIHLPALASFLGLMSAIDEMDIDHAQAEDISKALQRFSSLLKTETAQIQPPAEPVASSWSKLTGRISSGVAGGLAAGQGAASALLPQNALASAQRAVSGLGSMAPSLPSMPSLPPLPSLPSVSPGAIAADLSARASGMSDYGSALSSTLMEKVSGVFIDPLSDRLKACGSALEMGLVSGVGLGLVAGILCPPLLPVSAAGAVLIAFDAYRYEMDRTSVLDAEAKARRQAELEISRSEALKKIFQGSSAAQMQTADINLIIDAAGRAADAMILRGPYAGRNWSSLTEAQRAKYRTGTTDQGSLDLLDVADFTLGFLALSVGQN